MRFVIFLVIFAISVNLISATHVYGDVYKSNNFEKLNNSVIKIDGRFSYQMVNKKSNYSIELPEGDYNITAEYYDENGNIQSYAKQSFKLGADNQKIDLILLPTGSTFEYVAGAGLAIIGIFIFYNAIVKKYVEKKEEDKKSKIIELDDDAKKVLQTLDTFEGRATQKEIKDTLNFSDAKLSLILTELEQLRKIKKFKRGRGNIIRKL